MSRHPEFDVSPFDVVVVGARCAGATTAMLLARAGHSVLLVDRAEMPSDTVSTHGLWQAACVQLHRFGLLDAVAATGATPVATTLVRIGDDEIQFPLRPVAGVDRLYHPRRYALDGVLVDAARAAGAEVRTGVRVTDVVRDPTGRVAGIETEAFRAPARFVVGADGSRSRIAARVAAAAYDERPAAAACTYAYFEGVDGRGTEFHFATTGLQAGSFPTNDGQVCVWVNTPVTDVPALRADVEAGWWDRMHAAAPDLARRLAGARRVGRFTGSAGHASRFHVPYGPGWALVGDAGYLKDPFSGHGITDALRDAELLADALHDVLANGRDERAALATYHTLRDDLSRPVYEATWKLASWQWNPGDVMDVLGDLIAGIARETAYLADRAERKAAA